MAFTVFFLLLNIVISGSIAQPFSPPFLGYTSVKINNVDIGGTNEYVDVNNTRYNIRVFRGIPYAEPPIGERRFTLPVKKAPFETSFNATEFGDACMQNAGGIMTASEFLAHKKMSEDCLYLNIYAPADSTKKKAVMVYLHGGAWVTGSGMRHDGSSLAGYGDVVVVTLNYRLGVFGYLSTGDANAEGNFGTMDQMLALEWVKDNIGHFGGDPDAITLFGSATGSYDTILLAMLQKPSNGRLPIKRCIASSGSMITQSPFTKTFIAEPRTRAVALASRVGCNTTDNLFLNDAKLLIGCLRRMPAADIIKASDFYLSGTNPLLEFLWTPVQDGKLVKGRPMDLFKEDMDAFKTFKSVDLLLGANSGDGDAVFEVMIRKGQLPALGIWPPDYYISNDQLMNLISGIFENWPNHDGIAKAAQHEFLPHRNITGRQGRDALIDLFSDETFIMPAIATARVHEQMEPASRTYLYYFDYIRSVGLSTFRPEKAAHRSEQVMLFGPFVDDLSKISVKLTGVDEQVHLAMLTYWTNFAKYGNPSGDRTTATNNRPTLPKWPEFTLDKQQYMNIAANSTSALLAVKKDLRAKVAAFWLDYMPYLANQTCPVFGVACPTCPPIMDQYISPLRLTVGQAQGVIIVFAATLTFFAFTTIILLVCYFRLRKELLRQEVYTVKE